MLGRFSNLAPHPLVQISSLLAPKNNPLRFQKCGVQNQWVVSLWLCFHILYAVCGIVYSWPVGGLVCKKSGLICGIVADQVRCWISTKGQEISTLGTVCFIGITYVLLLSSSILLCVFLIWFTDWCSYMSGTDILIRAASWVAPAWWIGVAENTVINHLAFDRQTAGNPRTRWHWPPSAKLRWLSARLTWVLLTLLALMAFVWSLH